jgi:hypothetical protein
VKKKKKKRIKPNVLRCKFVKINYKNEFLSLEDIVSIAFRGKKIIIDTMWAKAPVTAGDVGKIDELFRQHAPSDRIFDERYVVKKTRPGKMQFSKTWGIIPAMHEIMLVYDHQNVRIEYRQRQTDHLDDIDFFVDTEIVIDGDDPRKAVQLRNSVIV